MIEIVLGHFFFQDYFYYINYRIVILLLINLYNCL